jgi:hypothetical protein
MPIWRSVEPGSLGSTLSSYGLYGRAMEVRSQAEARDLPYNLSVQTGSGSHPGSYTMGTVGPFPEGKVRSGHVADHSYSSSAEIVNE